MLPLVVDILWIIIIKGKLLIRQSQGYLNQLQNLNNIFKQMASTDQLRNQKIKTFEQKVLNQSLCDIRLYDKLADYLLECCHAEAKPNTLSLFSFLPLFILSFIATEPTTLSFILTIFTFLIHQILDIANKKQAYRLNKFSLATYYIDHLFDSLSCCYIVLIISRLLSLSGGASLTAVFFFGILPFYTHHLAMYNNEYMVFPFISPTTQGFMFTKILFLIAAFYPSFFQLQIGSSIFVYQIYISIALIWLAIFVFHDLYTIVQGKRVTDSKIASEQTFPLKNLFVIFLLGYLVLQLTSIQSKLIQDSVFFYFAFVAVTLMFAHIIGNLVLAYGYNEAYKQITLPFLVIMGSIVIYYAILVFGLKNTEGEVLASKIVMGIIFSLFLCGFVREVWKNILYINSVILN